MKQITSALATCLILAAGIAPTLAQETPQNTESQNAQPGIETSTAVTARATVQDIDYKNRTVTLKGQNGRIFTVKVGSEARNFNQVKKGDQVTFHREQTLALALRKPNEPATSGEAQTLMRAPAGEKPSGAVINTTQITATVENIDRQKDEVTLRGPEGNTKTIKVEHPEVLDRLKKGDQVVATLTDTFMIDVAPPQ